LKHEVGNEDHVIFGSIDAGPSAIQAIRDRFVDFIVDQPTQYYNALVVHWIMKYLDAEKDPSVLPKTGDSVEADAVDLSSNAEEHVGVDPWAEPLWAPADVVPYEQDESELHPYIKTNHAVINDENVDEPYLWGNWVEDA
jgi:ABC-type sugar transport system substrate-binding protein